MSAAKSMFLHMAKEMVAAKEILTKADQAIGDGDHGIGMSRGFEAVEEKLANQEFSSIDLLLKTTGMALISSIGGAAGAIFGTLFRAGSNRLTECTVSSGFVGFQSELKCGLNHAPKWPQNAPKVFVDRSL